MFATFMEKFLTAMKEYITKNHSSFVFPCNTFFDGHLVEDEKSSHPRTSVILLDK